MKTFVFLIVGICAGYSFGDYLWWVSLIGVILLVVAFVRS